MKRYKFECPLCDRTIVDGSRQKVVTKFRRHMSYEHRNRSVPEEDVVLDQIEELSRR